MSATQPLKLGALALALPPFLVPLYNPDLFWHLTSGQWIVTHGAVPRVDPFSIARAGAPWVDFEWLAQIIYYGVHAAAGMPGLWALKCALLGTCAWVFADLLSLNKVSGAPGAAGLVLLSALILPYADIRPDLFSWNFFLIVLGGLERRRLSLTLRRVDSPLGLLLIFSLWSNLHAGFILGLFLLGLYALLRTTSWSLLPAALLGSVLNPYGWGPYRVIFDHWNYGNELSIVIREWSPLSFQNPHYWPAWLLLAASAGAAVTGLRRKNIPSAPALAALFFAAQTFRHVRMSVYFGFLAIPLILPALTVRARAWTAAALLYMAHLGFLASGKTWKTTFDPSHVPAGAVEFMASQQDAFTGKNIFCHWGWGGYLGWRLKPWHKPFSDGRYLFHSLLPEIRKAHEDSLHFTAFLDKYGTDAVLLENRNIQFPSTKLYPDGRTKSFPRPWYLQFLPRERWALVYWDPQALMFARRKSFSSEWLSRREYRYVKPYDDAAFAEALSLREIPLPLVAEETARHERDLSLPAPQW